VDYRSTLLATANNKKQKLIIQDILSSPEIYARVASILKPEYFDAEYERVVRFIHEYNEKYSAVPAIDVLDAEFSIEFEPTAKITKDRIAATCDTVEKFCRESAAMKAVYASVVLIDDDDMGAVLELITNAVHVSLQKDLGVDVYDNPEERLWKLVEKFTPIPTLIDGLDGPLDGGLIRKQLTLFSANSGGGKSLMLQNIGHNYATQGYHVLNLTLELEEEMVFLRLGAILSGENIKNWQAHIPEISAGILKVKANSQGGSHIIKSIPEGSKAMDIRSYLKFYELEYNRVPDVLLVDYLDVMHPNCGISGLSISEQDKMKSEELRNILREYDMIGATASQQNREALTMNTPSQGGIAGGLSKVNTVDNYISLYMDDTMELDGVMNAYFLKSRSSHAKGKMSILGYNQLNLRIGNHKDGAQTSVMPTRRKKAEEKAKATTKPGGEVTGSIPGLPGLIDLEVSSIKQLPQDVFDMEEAVVGIPDMEDHSVSHDEASKLMGLMTSMGGAA